MRGMVGGVLFSDWLLALPSSGCSVLRGSDAPEESGAAAGAVIHSMRIILPFPPLPLPPRTSPTQHVVLPRVRTWTMPQWGTGALLASTASGSFKKKKEEKISGVCAHHFWKRIRSLKKKLYSHLDYNFVRWAARIECVNIGCVFGVCPEWCHLRAASPRRAQVAEGAHFFFNNVFLKKNLKALFW